MADMLGTVHVAHCQPARGSLCRSSVGHAFGWAGTQGTENGEVYGRARDWPPQFSRGVMCATRE